MSEHHARVTWTRTSDSFDYDAYNRDHTWEVGEHRCDASAAPAFGGTEGRVDPEAAFTASLSACHMLTFLAIAARKRWTVDAYEDDPVGHLEKNADGRLAMTRVVLRPRITFGAPEPDAEQVRAVHDKAHRACFIANSVHTEVTVEDGVEAGS